MQTVDLTEFVNKPGWHVEHGADGLYTLRDRLRHQKGGAYTRRRDAEVALYNYLKECAGFTKQEKKEIQKQVKEAKEKEKLIKSAENKGVPYVEKRFDPKNPPKKYAHLYDKNGNRIKDTDGKA